MPPESSQSNSFCGVFFSHCHLSSELCWWLGPSCKACTRKLITQSQTTLTLFQNARELHPFQKIFWEKKITSISVYNMAAIKEKIIQKFLRIFFRSFQKPYLPNCIPRYQCSNTERPADLRILRFVSWGLI